MGIEDTDRAELDAELAAVDAELAEMADLAREMDVGEGLEWVSIRQEVDDAAGRDPDPAFVGVDDERLVEGFVVAAAEVNAAMCRWLLMLAEIVARRIWVDHGARTPAEWLSYTVSMAPSTARERVRVALRLREFPRVTEAFAEGRLSYSKVRAITRTGRPDLEDLLLQYAEHATGSQMETIVRGFRGVRRRTADPLAAHERRNVERIERADGMVELRVVLPPEEGLAVWEQYDRHAWTAFDEAVHARDGDDPDAPPPSIGQLRADAAVEAATLLAGAQPDDTSGIDRHTLVLHAPADALTPPADGEDSTVLVDASAESRLHPMSVRQLRRLACDARLAVVAHDHDGNVVSASGTTRRIPARLRRMLHARDRGCRFPSCTSTRGLDGHHIVHWSDGGNTELSNLMLLCRYHHTFLHQRGWEILTDGHGHFRFQPPDRDPWPTVLAPPEVDPLAVYAGRDPFEFEPPGWPGPLAPTWDGTAPDYDACVGTLLEALDRLQPPHTEALAA